MHTYMNYCLVGFYRMFKYELLSCMYMCICGEVCDAAEQSCSLLSRQDTAYFMQKCMHTYILILKPKKSTDRV